MEKILFSIVFIFFNISIYNAVHGKREIKNKIISLLIFHIVIFVLALFPLFAKQILFLTMFSWSMAIILVGQRYKGLGLLNKLQSNHNKYYDAFKEVTTKIFPNIILIMFTVFQLFLIWTENLPEKFP
ncbi:MAG: hypothetical protein ACO1PI_05805 [Bacteroidota bacterium]